MRIVKFLSFLFVFFVCYNVNANDAKNWLDREINIIISAYQNSDLPNENKFLMIEQTINNNFAGTGIAKFVAGKSWKNASKDRFFVIDLLVADISLVVTKRSEFNSMLKTVDYNLKDFNEKLLSQNESSYQKLIKYSRWRWT